LSINQLLFETPWWLLVAIAVVAVALLMSGNRRQDRRLLLAGLIVLLLGAVLWLVSFLIDTPRELVARGSREFVQDVVKRDQSGLKNLLSPNATLMLWNRDDIIAGAMKYSDMYGLKSGMTSSLDVTETSAQLTSTFTVFSTHEAPNIPYNNMSSRWELTWMRSADETWRITTIKPIQVPGVPQEVLMRHFQGKP